MFFLQYPCKFHVLNPRRCLHFFWNSPFWGVQAKNLFIYWKLWVSIEEQQRAHPNYQKKWKIYQNLDFNYLKTVYKMLGLGIIPIFDNIVIANILRMWEKRGGLYPHPHPLCRRVGMLLPSEPVSQYICKKPRETDDTDRTHKNDSNTLSWYMVIASFWASIS